MKGEEPEFMPETPFLVFNSPADRPYGSIELFEETSATQKGFPFRYSRFRVAPGRHSSLDKHDVLEVWFVLSGTGQLSYDGGTYTITAGQAVHFGSQRGHQVLNVGKDDLVIFSFWWKRE
jgi:mannose-6-phosphate isomerase-like protein (cupin superfamily)